MARKVRRHQTSAFYHIILRGNNGQNIFFSDADRFKFCILIQQGLERFPHFMHGFCLMRNHVHLVLQAGDGPISSFMHHLSSCYAQYINRTQHRKGHLFQDRYCDFLVNDEAYLLKLIQYVHLNPVRAGLVKTPENYLWSSHQTYIGKTKILWLTQEVVLKKFHQNQNNARNLFHQYVLAGIGEKFAKEIHLEYCQETKFYRSNDALQVDFSLKTIMTQTPQLNQMPRSPSIHNLLEIVLKLTNFSLEELQSSQKHVKLSQARGILAFLVRKSNLKFKDLAVLLSKDASALSRLASATEKIAHSNADLTKLIQQAREALKALAGVDA